MPKLWDDTIDAHKRAVRDATLEKTAALIAKNGLRSVTMSQIADETGIGRATLYKYFPDVESILRAWHERQIAAHLEQLGHIKDQPGDARARLAAVLEAFAFIQHGRHDAELAALLHRGPHVAQAHEHLRHLVRDLIADAAKGGRLRRDVPADELAVYCLNALSGASLLSSKPAVRRLVAVTLAGLDA